ncbi:MAG: ATP-binding protein [Bacteroidota bacterium]|nr:ATP-binding protein [Bacteroidota bacterium]
MNRIYKELRIPSTLESLRGIEVFVEEICDIYNINNSYFGNILIAIEEAVTNAIVHGNKLDPDKEVLVIFRSMPNGLCFSIEDQGDGFNFRNIPNPLEVEESASGMTGKGLFLINSLADKVDFNLRGNKIELVFNISSINQETTLNRIKQLQSYFEKQKSIAKK